MPIRSLSPALAKKAKDELNEDPGKIEEDIQILREWISKQPHINARTDDQFLLAFIRSSKHSMERAKRKIDLFYTIRTAMPEIFKNRRHDDPTILAVLRQGVFLFLPKPLSEDGPRICIIRPGYNDPHKYVIYDSVRPGSMVQDIELISDDNLITSGVVEIIDLANVTMAHFLQFDVVFMKKISLLGGEGSALRHKGTHFINTPAAFEKVFNLFRSFMNEKQRSRLFVHGSNMEALYKHVPQKLLPKEYGGENGSISEIIQYWEKRFEANREFFVEEDQYGTIEKLRASDSKFNPETLFGMDGTFRKLNVD